MFRKTGRLKGDNEKIAIALASAESQNADIVIVNGNVVQSRFGTDNVIFVSGGKGAIKIVTDDGQRRVL